MPEHDHSPIWDAAGEWDRVRRGETEDFQDIYDRGRKQCPLAWRPVGEQGHWTALDYEIVDQILLDPETFSSATPKYGAPMIPIELDPPHHGEYRQLLWRLINPVRVKRFEPKIRQFVGEAIEDVLSGGASLLDATGAIPLRSFCMLAGEEAPDAWKSISQEREDGNENRLALLDEASIAKRKAALQPIMDHCAKAIADRRKTPGDDLVTDVISGVVAGRPVTDDEALRILTLIYVAGHRTTTAALRGAVVLLARNTEVQSRLRADRSAIPAAIEEILRLETPIHGLPRYVTRSVEIAGVQLQKGDQVFPNFGAANVDPKVFPNPSEFDIDRRPNRHVAFGRGIHVCAGAPLARMQLSVFIDELLTRCAAFSLDGPVTRPVWPHFGATTLPVQLRRVGEPTVASTI